MFYPYQMYIPSKGNTSGALICAVIDEMVSGGDSEVLPSGARVISSGYKTMSDMIMYEVPHGIILTVCLDRPGVNMDEICSWLSAALKRPSPALHKIKAILVQSYFLRITCVCI